MHVLVGQSPQMAEIRVLVEKLGRSQAPVLLLGESGTGKEVAARAIHDAGGHGAFVAIDCGALVGPLMESELFGHTRGAFTGASESKKGLIEIADGGTAFFDEIGDLRLDLQVKLLRLLQEREFRPVGSVKPHKVNIRVIAATHRDLETAVARAEFRQDLYYRLNVVKLRLPPLRERREDIPVLIEHFLRRFGPSYRVSADAMEAMLAYNWPGNVRELQNAIERMTAINSGPWLHQADLPSSVMYYSRAMAPAPMPDEAGELPVVRLPLLRATEEQAIRQAMAECAGDRTRTARVLGIGRTTLYRKLKAYGIQ